MKRIIVLLFCISVVSCVGIQAQQVYDLKGCLQYALENNRNIRKSKFDLEKSEQARREMIGTLLPQVSGSGSMNYNIKKAKFIMPNFINSMLPPAMQDPNADEYMTIEMGMNYSAAVSASLNQQVVNFSLFNALDIAKTAESLTALAVEAKEEDVISQTANLFYAVQVTGYAVELFGKSVSIIDTMLKTMEVSYSSGLVKKIDLDRLRVTRTNLMTQQAAMKNAVEVQKNLLKLQMGVDMEEPLDIEKINLEVYERLTAEVIKPAFSLNDQISYQMLEKQVDMTSLQRKAAIYETLPVLTAMVNYSYNGVSDEFFRGETNYWYPTSVAGLSLRVPIFAGLSKSAKIKQADAEIKKINEDSAALEQTLTMAYKNAAMKLEDSRRTIQVQRDNMLLAEEVYRISGSNYSVGLASMSDVLNASNSLIQSQMSYADALNNFMKAWIELQKASGTIKELAQ